MRNKVLVGVVFSLVMMGGNVTEAACVLKDGIETCKPDVIAPNTGTTGAAGGATNTCDTSKDLAPLFAPINSVWKPSDAVCQIDLSAFKCDKNGCTGNGGGITCDFTKLYGEKSGKMQSMGVLGTPCELASIALASLSESSTVQCVAGKGAIDNATGLYLNQTPPKVDSTSPDSSTTKTQNEKATSQNTTNIDLACTDFLDPVPVSLLSGSMKDSYCVSVTQEILTGRTPVPTTKGMPPSKVMDIFQVNLADSSQKNKLCQAILTHTGSIGVVAGFALFAFQTIQTLLIGIAIIGVVVSGIQMMFMGGSEEAQKKAIGNLIRILSGLALLFTLKIILSTIAPDFFTIETPKKLSSTIQQIEYKNIPV